MTIEQIEAQVNAWYDALQEEFEGDMSAEAAEYIQVASAEIERWASVQMALLECRTS